MKYEADYVVVGAGSAGCALAARLAEDQQSSVILLEAGGPDSDPRISIPVAYPDLFGTAMDWGYRTEAQPMLDGRRLAVPRGPASCIDLIATPVA